MQPIHAALLSYGMSGEVFHAPLISALPEFKLHTIVERRSSRARDHYNDVRIVHSIDDAIGDRSIELIVVNTPNETHYEFSRRAIEAGKHVVVEKPFTVDMKEGEMLIDLAEQNGVTLTVFQNRRWDGDFLTVRHVLEKKLLGDVVSYEAHYDRFRNYIEPNTWKEEKRPGTGIVYNLGSHMLDQAVQLFGMPHYVDARIGIQRPGGRVDDFYDIRMEYDSMLATIRSSYLVKEDLPRYIIHGVEGSFVKYGIDPQEQDLKEKKNPLNAAWGKEAEENWGKLNTTHGEKRIETVPGDYLAFYRNLFKAIRLKEAILVQPKESLDVIRLIEACYESNYKKMAIRVL